jgi:hypothetical protein
MANEALSNFLSGATTGPSLAALPKTCPVSVLSFLLKENNTIAYMFSENE